MIKVRRVSAFFSSRPQLFSKKLQKVLDIDLTTWYKGYVEWLRKQAMALKVDYVKKFETATHHHYRAYCYETGEEGTPEGYAEFVVKACHERAHTARAAVRGEKRLVLYPVRAAESILY